MSTLNTHLLKEDNDKAYKETKEYSCSLKNKSNSAYHNEINRKNKIMQIMDNKDINEMLKSNFSSINNSYENSNEEENYNNNEFKNENIDNIDINHLEEVRIIITYCNSYL